MNQSFKISLRDVSLQTFISCMNYILTQFWTRFTRNTVTRSPVLNYSKIYTRSISFIPSPRLENPFINIDVFREMRITYFNLVKRIDHVKQNIYEISGCHLGFTRMNMVPYHLSICKRVQVLRQLESHCKLLPCRFASKCCYSTALRHL